MSKKKSQYTGVSSVPSSYDFNIFTNGVDRRIPKSDLFKQIKDESFSPFIYPTIELLQAADLEVDVDNPAYCRCEETEYRLYKITNAAPGVDDIALTNGNTAEYQVEYRDTGFVTSVATSAAGYIPVFTDSTGQELDKSVVPTNTGKAFIQAADSATVTFPRKNADNTITMRSASQYFDDIKQNATHGAAGVIKTADGTSTLAQTATDEAVTPANLAALKASSAEVVTGTDAVKYVTPETLQDKFESDGILTIATVADISTTSMQAGQIFELVEYHAGTGKGGRQLKCFAGSITPDNVLTFNGPTGFYLESINIQTLTVHHAGAVGDGVTDDTVAVQRAINATYGRVLFFPAGKYLCGRLFITQACKWIGESEGLYPTDYVTDESRIDFSAVPDGEYALQIGDGVNQIIGGSIVGLGMSGKPTINGLFLGGNIDGSLTDWAFRDINMYSFNIGIHESFVYDLIWDNVRVQSTVNALVNGDQTNATLFKGCRFVSCTGVLISHTNCEGIHYDTCDMSNASYVGGAPITLFQSTVTMTNPYIENISNPIAIYVGGGSEVEKSSLVLTNPLKILNDIQAGIGAYVKMDGALRGNCRIIGTQLNHCPSVAISSDKRNLTINSARIISKTLAGYNPRFQGTGSPILTYTPRRGYYIIQNTGPVGSGVIVASNLVVGRLYTLYMCIKAGVLDQIVNIRHGASSLSYPLTAFGSPAEVSKFPFVATATSFSLEFVGTIEYYGHYIEEGNETGLDLSVFSRADLEYYQGSSSSAPATGTWRLGDTMLHTDPAASGSYGFICTAAGSPGTWKTFGAISA